MKKALAFVLLSLVVILSGCVSAQEWRDRRAQEHPEWLEGLSAADQARILGGHIAIGDSSGAVWIALGTPSHTALQASANSTNVVWSYTEMETYLAGTHTYIVHDYPPPPPRRHHHHRPPPPPPAIQTVNTDAEREVERLSVTFVDDHVVSLTTAR